MRPGLPLKVSFTVVGDEESSNGTVGIVRAEVFVSAVKAAELAVLALDFEDGSTHRCIAQFLRQAQIFRLADPSEFGPMLLVMLVELRLAAKARSAGCGDRRQREHSQDTADCVD